MAGTQRTKNGNQADIIPFLTAWDPSDLPGGSVDPLGFDRGYNALADKILPGLTNVAALPEVLRAALCGASLGPDTVSPSRTEVEERRDCILRLERLWALAVVLAAEGGGPDASGVEGSHVRTSPTRRPGAFGESPHVDQLPVADASGPVRRPRNVRKRRARDEPGEQEDAPALGQISGKHSVTRSWPRRKSRSLFAMRPGILRPKLARMSSVRGA